MFLTLYNLDNQIIFKRIISDFSHFIYKVINFNHILKLIHFIFVYFTLEIYHLQIDYLSSDILLY